MIRLENVNKTFVSKRRKTIAVKDFSLEIKEGELCIFLGPSGCGKTTSLKMINRLIPLTSGKIFINGIDIMKHKKNELRRGIGYAIQNIGLFPHMTVEENIATVPILKKWSKSKQRARAEELLDLVGMNPAQFLHRYPSELSGGQQQRVGVARALGADPPILLMDEPFGAIDPITRMKLQDEFLKIQSKLKKTIVFVTHDIEEAIKMGDKIALMKNGELVQFDEPANLLYNPKNDFVRNFVGSDHILKGLRLHKAKDFIHEPKFIISEDDDPVKVKSIMESKKIKWGILINKNNNLLGWIKDKDLTPNITLKDIAITPVTAELNTSLNVALSMMLNTTFGTLAVLDNDDKFAGIITFQNIRESLSQQINEIENEERGDKK